MSAQLGLRAEQQACDYLVKKGYRIVARNYRANGGELDIVAQQGDDLVFIEVKERKSLQYGYPEESVGKVKLSRICRAIAHYLHTHKVTYRYYRFDIIAIGGNEHTHDQFCHIENVELPTNIIF